MQPFIDIFGLHIATYGLLAMTGTLLGLGLLALTAKWRGLQRSDAMYGAVYALIGGLIGAKLLYIIVELPHILAQPNILESMIFSGFVFYGGVIGGVIGAWRYSHRYRVSLTRMFDVYAAPIALGQAIGRVGCFFAGCCYGMQVDSPFSVIYPEGSFAPSGVPILATQLMESAFLLILVAILLVLLRKTKRLGLVSGVYLVGYGVWRFIIEFFRSDERGGFWGLSTSQWISFLIVAGGVALLVYAPKMMARLQAKREEKQAEKNETEEMESKEQASESQAPEMQEIESGLDQPDVKDV